MRAHRDPAGLPAALAALATEADPGRRSDAIADLDRLLFGRGGLYSPGRLCPGAEALVGPLLKIAADRTAPGRTDVLALLAALARECRAAVASSVIAGCRDALRAGVARLLTLSRDPQPLVRALTMAVLGELGWCADKVIPALLGRFARERDPTVRLALVLAVGHLVGHAPQTAHRGRAMTWLRRRRSSADGAVRLVATALAWRVGSVRAKDLPKLLHELSGDPAALSAVVAVTGDRVGDWLAGELGGDRDARVAVADRLLDIPAGAGVEALRAAAGAISGWRSAATALLPAVAARLADPDPGVRGCAAHLLAVVGPGLAGSEPSGLPDALADALTDPAARVADLAAWGLSRMDDPRCLPRLRNRALIGTSVFDVVQAYYPREVYLFSAPGLLDVLGPLAHWAEELLPRIRSALSDADSYHQRRVLAEVLGRWGSVAAPAVPELAWLLNSDAARHACFALGAVGPPAGAAAHRLFRLIERSTSSRLRAVAAWAYWRVSGDAEPALRILGDALEGELGAEVLPLLADLGPLAVDHVDRVQLLGAADNDWLRTEAARALWRLTGAPADPSALLLPVLASLADGRTTPVTRRALAVATELSPLPADVLPLLRAVADSDRRYAYYGDFRAVTDDEELAGLAAAALPG